MRHRFYGVSEIADRIFFTREMERDAQREAAITARIAMRPNHPDNLSILLGPGRDPQHQHRASIERARMVMA